MRNEKSKKTLFIGDVNVDLIFGGLKSPVQEDKEVAASSFEVTMGSSAIITAVVFSSLGGKSESCGLAGNDEYGQFMLQKLKDFNIGTEHITIDPSTSTGITVNLIYHSTRSQVTYLGGIYKFIGPNLNSNYEDISHVHFSGIYQQLSFLPNLVETIKYFKSLGITVSLDTQWDQKEEWAYLDEILPLLDILFVNKDEAESIVGSNNVEDLKKFFKNKSKLTSIKLGSKGSLILTGDELIEIEPFTVDVVDTTGAGDTYAATFLYAINTLNYDFFEAGQFASAAAGISCKSIGGVNGEITIKKINKFLEARNVN